MWTGKPSCLVWYYRARTWDDAMERCRALAPTGSTGRLAHVNDSTILDQVRRKFKDGPFFLWIGMRTKNSGSQDYLKDWRWMSDSISPIPEQPWDPRPYVRLSLGTPDGNC